MSYPYANTTGGLLAVIRQLRSAFPSQVTSDTLKKWSIAPNNETYLLAVLRFLSFIDENGKKQPAAAKVFLEHDDSSFAEAFSKLVEAGYKELFEAFGEQVWTLDRNKLIGFFRAADSTSATVGTRQAQTFQALAQVAGYISPSPSKEHRPSSRAQKTLRKETKGGGRQTAGVKPEEPAPASLQRSIGGAESPQLTIRVEINLPVTDDQSVYDKIFASIRPI